MLLLACCTRFDRWFSFLNILFAFKQGCITITTITINCPTCPYIEPGTVLQSSNTSKKNEINGTFNCKTRNVVYCIKCEKCKLQYIGQTTRSLDERVREHIG